MRDISLTLVTAAIFSVITAACNGPSDDAIAVAFIKENPTLTVVAIRAGEGDGSTVYKHIRYRKPESASECEVVWGYQEMKREWKVFYKGEPLAVTLVDNGIRKPCV